MIEIGDKLELDFTVKAFVSGEEKELLFKELLKKPTVISVYMKNNTPSCNLQVASLVDAESEIEAMGFGIIAISKDTCGSHKKYAEKKGVHYALVSDPDYHFAKATDSLVEKKMYGKTFVGPSRSAYVVDANGVVLGVVEKIKSKEHSKEIIELLASLNL